MTANYKHKLGFLFETVTDEEFLSLLNTKIDNSHRHQITDIYDFRSIADTKVSAIELLNYYFDREIDTLISVISDRNEIMALTKIVEQLEFISKNPDISGGPYTDDVNSIRTFTINNFKSSLKYNISVTAGSVVQNGNIITVTSPSEAAIFNLDVNGKIFVLTANAIIPVVVADPIIIVSPGYIRSSPFTLISGVDSFYDLTWTLYLDGVVQQSYETIPVLNYGEALLTAEREKGNLYYKLKENEEYTVLLAHVSMTGIYSNIIQKNFVSLDITLETPSITQIDTDTVVVSNLIVNGGVDVVTDVYWSVVNTEDPSVLLPVVNTPPTLKFFTVILNLQSEINTKYVLVPTDKIIQINCYLITSNLGSTNPSANINITSRKLQLGTPKILTPINSQSVLDISEGRATCSEAYLPYGTLDTGMSNFYIPVTSEWEIGIGSPTSGFTNLVPIPPEKKTYFDSAVPVGLNNELPFRYATNWDLFNGPIRNNLIEILNYYNIRVRHSHAFLGYSDWSETVSFNTVFTVVVNKPTFTNINNGSIDVEIITLFKSSLISYSSPEVGHMASDWQIARDPEFNNLFSELSSSSQFLYEWVSPELKHSNKYYIRVRYITYNNVYSPWSDPIEFTTKAMVILVSTPGVISPGAGSTDTELLINYYSTEFALLSGIDTHAATEWQLSIYNNMRECVVNYVNSGDLRLITHSLAQGTTYYIRCRHISSSGVSSNWSPIHAITTKLILTQVTYRDYILSDTYRVYNYEDDTYFPRQAGEALIGHPRWGTYVSKGHEWGDDALVNLGAGGWSNNYYIAYNGSNMRAQVMNVSVTFFCGIWDTCNGHIYHHKDTLNMNSVIHLASMNSGHVPSGQIYEFTLHTTVTVPADDYTFIRIYCDANYNGDYNKNKYPGGYKKVTISHHSWV